MAGKRIAVFSLFALVALALAVFASSGTQAQTYKPSFAYTVTDNTGGAASNTINIITIPAPDYNYEDSSLYTFTPIDGISVTGTEIPIADEVGTLAAKVAVGLVGGPCSTPLPPVFVLENASVDNSEELSADEMYWVLKSATLYAVPYRDKCENDIDDDGDTFVNDGCPAIGPAENPATECADDVDDDSDSYGISNNGVNDGCPAVDSGELLTDPLIPDYLEVMPHFVNDMLDPDGRHDEDPPLQPRARYVGYTTVAGMHIIVQFIVLNPGQLSELGGIKAQMGSELGHPSLVILNNPISQEEAPGAISDFCTPLVTTTELLATTVANQYDGGGGDITARTNPPTDSGVLGSGTHMSRNYSQGERDADGDGIENDLDPCHYTSDVGWDARAAVAAQPGLDTDGDGLPDTCDPVPAISDIDEDDDGYNNRQDICPLVPSGCNTPQCSQEFPKVWNPAWENMGDDEGAETNTDDGPGPDSIGNACDDSNDDGMEDGSGPNPGSGDCNDGIDNDCADDIDNDPTDDGQPAGTYINDGCPAVDVAETDCGPDETLPLDDDSDGFVNDGCATQGSNPEADGIDGNDPDCVPFMDAAAVGKCRDAIDRDGDTKINDGCPQKGAAPEVACNDDVDDDADTRVNDGCPKAATDDDTDDEGEDTAGRRVNDGCPAVDAAETGVQCENDLDDDADTTVNDGCDQVGDTAEAGAECTDPEDPGIADLSTIWGDDPSTGIFHHAMPASAVTIGGEEDPSCVNDVDDDADDKINDGCPAKDDPEVACDDAVDDDADTRVNDGCPAVDDPESPECANDTDDDADTTVNDGCPQKGDDPEVACDDAVDDDADTNVNDGCPANTSDVDDDGDGYSDALETALGSPTDNGAEDPSCVNAIDDDGDTNVNDGCPAKDTPEDPSCVNALDDDTLDTAETTAGRRINDGCPAKDAPEDAGTECNDDVDDDADTRVNDGCPKVGDDPENPACANITDDDFDDRVNDGCPQKGAEPENPECVNLITDDGDAYVNDGCPKVGGYIETGAECANATDDDADTVVNDGCPVIGVPESLVIDMTLSVGAGSPPESGGSPAGAAAQSCSDDIDNDGDTDIDGDDDDDKGCDETTYNPDDDRDGVENSTDNCSAIRNPEQTNTDEDLAAGGASFGGVPLTGDAEGDPCDDDDDNDGYTDAREWYLGTDPLDNCPNVAGKHAAWPLDINMDQIVTVSFDVLPYRGNIQVSVDSNPPTSWSLRRLDLNGDGIITVSFDVLPFRGNIQKPCT